MTPYTHLVFTLALAMATVSCGSSDAGESNTIKKRVKRPGGADGTGVDGGLGSGSGVGTGTGTNVAGGTGTGSGTGTGTGSGTGTGTDTSTGDTGLSLIDGFKDTVFPVVREYCAGCHATIQTPFFAQENPELALKAIQDTGKVNFDAAQDSRLVKRLAAENHHCWTQCPADAETMQAAVQAWKDASAKEETKATLETTPLMLTDAVERDNATDPLTLAGEAETGTLAAPMVASTNKNASGATVISVPAVGGAVAINNPQTQGIGGVVHTFEVKEAGTYSVFGLVNAPSNTANRFFVRIDANAFAAWTITPNGAAFTWDRVTRVVNNVVSPLTAQLQPGTHTVEVRRSRPGTNLDMVALTANPVFDGTQAVVGKAKVLRYDLGALLKEPEGSVLLEIEMADFNDKAYKFRGPRLVTSSAKVRLKGLKILVNGTYDPQHSTYNLVDVTASAPGAPVSTAAMVVIKDMGTANDQISFTFDALEVVP
jgi:hypothetical protein